MRIITVIHFIMLFPSIGLVQPTTLQITELDPMPDSVLRYIPTEIMATFSAEVLSVSVSNRTFSLMRSGGDSVFYDGNYKVVTANCITLVSPTEAKFDLTGTLLPNDLYQVTLRGGVCEI